MVPLILGNYYMDLRSACSFHNKPTTMTRLTPTGGVVDVIEHRNRLERSSHHPIPIPKNSHKTCSKYTMCYGLPMLVECYYILIVPLPLCSLHLKLITVLIFIMTPCEHFSKQSYQVPPSPSLASLYIRRPPIPRNSHTQKSLSPIYPHNIL